MAPEAPSVGLGDFAFHVHWDIFALGALIVFGYVYGVKRLAAGYAPRGEPAVTRRQVAWFVTGMAFYVFVEAWPVHDIAEQSLFSVHMVEHLVLALVVPPALLKGTPEWLLRLITRPILPVLRVLTRPLIALVAFNAALAFIHAPAVLQAMLDSEPVHLVLHVALVGTSFLMWWPVIGSLPEITRLEPPAAMGYLFLQSLVPTIPASFLTFASDPVYDAYVGFPRLWGISVMDDQLVAGLIMKIGGGLLLWGVITVIFFKWAGAEDRASQARRITVRPPS